jgi:hypothetical protein
LRPRSADVKRLILFLAVTACIVALGFVLPRITSLSRENALALVAVAELAAAIFALVPESSGDRPACKTYDAYFLVANSWPLRFSFDTKVVNVGDAPDTLERISYAFYNGSELIKKGDLVAGARELTKESGQVLPCSTRIRILS